MRKKELYIYGYQIPFNLNDNEELIRKKWAGEVRLHDIVFLEGFSEGFLIDNISLSPRRDKATHIQLSFRLDDTFIEVLLKKDEEVLFC